MDAAEKEKAEKVAAARKKYEQLKKQKEKSKKTTKKGEDTGKAGKDKDKDVKKKADKKKEEDEEKVEEEEEEDKGEESNEKKEEPADEDDRAAEVKVSEETPTSPPPLHERKQSLSLQSKLRSESFRRGSDVLTSPGPTSPGEEVAEIYRKQSGRLEELERDNRRQARELEAAEARSRKLEDEVEQLREGSLELAQLKAKAEKVDSLAAEMDKVKQENVALQRQNTQLQQDKSKSGRSRGQSNASPTGAANTGADLQAELDSKTATIESMSLELSSLQAQLTKSTSSTSDASESHKSQVQALESKLAKAEKTAKDAQGELKDLRTKVDRLSAAAVKEGSEKSSTATRIATLERELAGAQKQGTDATKRAETLDAKLETLTKLQREAEPRRKEAERAREIAVKEAASMKQKLSGLEAETRRLKAAAARERSKGEVDDDGIDELEDEERKRLEARIRELEGENFELRRGVWRDKRREMQGGMEEHDDGHHGPISPGAAGGQFDEVDLSGGFGGPSSTSHASRPSMSRGRSGFATVLSSGFNAFTGGGGSTYSPLPSQQQHSQSYGNPNINQKQTQPANQAANQGGNDGFLSDDDEFAAFDEDAFRKAHEQEALQRIERVKEIKRGLSEWRGWRMDLVELRMGGGGEGEIFEV